METWRLIIHKKQNGAWNMAVDEALLESTAKKNSPPALRLYDWEPYTLSLGYAQAVRDVNINALNRFQWGLVRRPTGGKAILHADELTYSVTAPDDNEIMSGSVVESYQRLSIALLQSLEKIGISADSKPKDEKLLTSQTSSICFQHPSDYEITYNNKKLIGSAQARKKGGVLQHGAVPLFGNITRIIDVLMYPDDQEKESALSRLLDRATTIENILNKNISWNDMSAAMQYGFEKALQITFVQADLTEFEVIRSKEIYEEKYSNEKWTNRI